jgi:RHS repeat-associated protein
MTDNTTRHLNYIYAVGSLIAICEQKNNTDIMHYVYSDYLGSLRCITSENSAIEQRLSYDAWGSRRDYQTGLKLTDTQVALATTLTNRGFTGQEHIDGMGLINLNARMYEPGLGIFLSPDNYTQAPKNSQNFNRYTYCLNNPLKYTDPSGLLFGWDDLAAAGIGFGLGYLSHGISTGNWGWDAVVSGVISAGVSWLTYTTAGAASSWLVKAGVSKGVSTVVGNGVGSAIGSFVGNVAGQTYFTGSVNINQAGKAALYGFGYGIGSGLSDVAFITKRFPFNHTLKYMARSTVGELLGNIFSGGDVNSMTFGLNPGIVLPFASDIGSLSSPYWSYRIAQQELESTLSDASKEGVSISSNIKVRSTIDYGVNTETSGLWIVATDEGDRIFDEVGIDSRVEIQSGGFTINKIGSIVPQGLNFPNMSGFKVNVPVYKLPFNYMSAIHFSNAYSLSFSLWRR